jgi:hypothetical protein
VRPGFAKSYRFIRSAGSATRPDLFVEGEFERPRRRVVERIGHGDDEAALGDGEPDYPCLLQERSPDALGGDGLCQEFGRIEDQRPDHLGMGGNAPSRRKILPWRSIPLLRRKIPLRGRKFPLLRQGKFRCS